MGGMMWRRVAAVAVALSVAVGLGTMLAPPASAQQRSMQSLLKSLKVAPERPAGYNRSLFPHWDSVGRGCTVRSIVLIEEARRGPSTGRSCPVGTGTWFSEFDGVTVNEPARLDIDHMVPLAEAWRSGARHWSTPVRRAFANDLGYAGSLIAVTASSNRSKGDQDPARWLPPRTAYRCTYIGEWIAVKWRWRLRVDASERAALRVQVSACGNPRITVPTRAR